MAIYCLIVEQKVFFVFWIENDERENQVSISSTFYVQILLTNVILAAFSSYMYITCTWKKLPKQRSYEKRTCEIDGRRTGYYSIFARQGS